MGMIKEYKCPACGAALAFDAADGTVKCSYCEASFEVKDIIAAQKPEGDESEFDWGDYKNGLSSEHLEDTVVYQCESCGAIIETDANTAATTCPYCGNNVVMSDRVSGGLKPNAIIPFKVDKSELQGLLKNYYKDKKLLPRDFFSKGSVSKAQGVYVPFWLFDCDLSGEVSFDATKVMVYSTAKETVTQTSHYVLERDGNMSFSNVPADASTKMDNDLMDSVEPYDFSELVPFDGAYLSGYLADRFDSDPDSELPRAKERTLSSAYSQIASSVADFNSCTPRSNKLKLDKASVKYALLPLYILNCDYEGKKYRYVINGQTGKVSGELPIGKAESFKVFLKGLLITGAIVFPIVYFLF